MELFDYMMDNGSKFPVTNELVNSYVDNYLDNMFDTEEELYSFINNNIEEFKKDHNSKKTKLRFVFWSFQHAFHMFSVGEVIGFALF